MYSRAEKRFLNINLVSIISLFLLILAGGVVRSSGSGMGCPDWPKCFDQYIPPTDISQLPLNYQEKYTALRLRKNERFAKLLDQLGYKDLAVKIRHDKAIAIPELFNPFKTYTEYINRLIGALTGLFLLITLIYSFQLIKERVKLFWLSLLNIVLVVFQAWLGSIVVSTNLVAWIITIHMLVAILILAIAIYTYQDIKYFKHEVPLLVKPPLSIQFISIVGLIISIIQITLGTEVREKIDAVQHQFPELLRSEWLFEVGRVFVYHRDLALLMVFINFGFYLLIRKFYLELFLRNLSNYLLVFLTLQIISGLALSYFELNPWAQAPHILFATLMFGLQFYIFLSINKIRFTIN
jgi:cytochrome c oxidase assembly protein subunit 15